MAGREQNPSTQFPVHWNNIAGSTSRTAGPINVPNSGVSRGMIPACWKSPVIPSPNQLIPKPTSSFHRISAFPFRSATWIHADVARVASAPVGSNA
jgi:hypothetical protein